MKNSLQNKIATAKHKSHSKTKKSRRTKKTTAKQNLKTHDRLKEPRQNEKAAVKQKSHGETKMPWKNK